MDKPSLQHYTMIGKDFHVNPGLNCLNVKYNRVTMRQLLTKPLRYKIHEKDVQTDTFSVEDLSPFYFTSFSLIYQSDALKITTDTMSLLLQFCLSFLYLVFPP